MIKIFSALSLEELEDMVNNFTKADGRKYEITNHSISHCNGVYVMSVVLHDKYYY